MRIVAFSEFARRRAERAQPEAPVATPIAHALDRWAALHSPDAEAVKPKASAPVIPIDMTPEDFWTDLEFRMAYPTHRLRRH